MIPFNECPICGGEMVQKKVEKIIRGGNHTAIVHITAEVCLNCGERLYSQNDVKRFEQIRDKLVSQETHDFEPLGQTFQVAS